MPCQDSLKGQLRQGGSHPRAGMDVCCFPVCGPLGAWGVGGPASATLHLSAEVLLVCALGAWVCACECVIREVD